MLFHRLLLAATLTASVAAAAHADEPARRSKRGDDDGLREAKRRFERGEKLYALTKFDDALKEYQKAFDAKPIPDFLFNIGQCYRNLGDYDAAIFSYRKYLKLAPDAPNREQVEQLITELEAKQQKAESERLGLTAKPREPEPEPEPAEHVRPSEPDERPVYTRWWFWTGIAVVGVAGGVGVYAATRSSGPPDTSLGNIVFGK